MTTARRFILSFLRRQGSSFVPAAIWLVFLISSGLAFGVTLFPGSAGAEPYRPADTATVVARLARADEAEGDRLQSLRARLADDPSDATAALDLARHYVARNRADADPRYLGYAQAVLAPWRGRDDAPAAIMTLRAVLAQRLHRFEAALADFDLVLSRQPDHGQARLSRAFVLQALGRHRAAGEDCRRLPRGLGELAIATCLARVESLTGGAVAAQARLATALQVAAKQPATLRLWALTNLAEIAARRGDAAAAEQAFRGALGLGRADSYLRDAFADFLLDAGRHTEVRRLLEDEPRSDGHLLRLALAGQALAHPDLSAETSALQARFEAARRRGDGLHLREQARFALAFGDRPDRALQLALANWQVQREPIDLRLLLTAALAAGQPEAVSEAVVWLERSGLEDPALRALLAQVKAISA